MSNCVHSKFGIIQFDILLNGFCFVALIRSVVKMFQNRIIIPDLIGFTI